MTEAARQSRLAEAFRRKAMERAMERIERSVLDKVLAGDELADDDRRILEGLRDRLALAVGGTAGDERLPHDRRRHGREPYCSRIGSGDSGW